MPCRRFFNKRDCRCWLASRNGIYHFIPQDKKRDIKKYIMKQRLKIREIVNEIHKILPKSEYRWPVYGIRWEYIWWIDSMDKNEFKRHMQKTIVVIAREMIKKYLDESKRMEILCNEHAEELVRKEREEQKKLNILCNEHRKEREKQNN